MDVVLHGHTYDLKNKRSGTQRLQFFKDLPTSEPEVDGVLCQEVIRALVDRYLELFNQKPCSETMKIIQYLRKCLILAEKRAFGNTLDKAYAKSGLNVEQLPVKENGHLFDITQPQRAEAGESK